MRNSPFEPENGLFKSDVDGGAEVVAFSLESRMRYFVELDVDISGVKVKALLALSLEQYYITVLHALLQLESQISRGDDDLISATDGTTARGTKSGPSASLALHLHLLHLILHLHFSHHLSRTTTHGAGLFLASLISSALAVLADLTSPEAVDHLSTRVELIQRHPHLRPEITALPQRILLELFEPSLAVQVIGDPLGDVNQYLVGPFDFDVLLECVLIVGVAIGMVLDGQSAEGLLEFVTGGLFGDFQQFVEVGFALGVHQHHQQEQSRQAHSHQNIHVTQLQALLYADNHRQTTRDHGVGSLSGLALLEAFQGLEGLGHVFVLEGDESEELTLQQVHCLCSWQLVLLAEYLHVFVLIQPQLHFPWGFYFGQSFHSNYLGGQV